MRPSWDRDRVAAVGLAVWGLVAGTLAGLVLTRFWLALGLSPPLAFFAAIVAVASPLFWFTAARPMSDVPGLVAAVAVQAWFADGLRAMRGCPTVKLPREWLWAAFGGGIIVGLRSQTMWLTGPLLFWCVGELVAYRRIKDAMTLVGVAVLGVLAWAVPLVWVTGGVPRYLDALTSQGAQDFTNIEMLATTPTWHLLTRSLGHTFVEPWHAAALAKGVLVLATVGVARLVWRGPRMLALVLLSFWPYLVFHTVFQETITLRYSLPLVVPVAGLAVIGLSALGIRVTAVAVAAIAATSLVLTEPPLQAYARDGAPVFRAFEDMQQALPATAQAPVVRMHHQVWWGVLRLMEWYRPYWDLGLQPFPGDREWLGVVRHWTAGKTQPVWFLADLTRNDLTLFDHRARTLAGRYELPPDIRAFMPGVRLVGLNWWTIQRPTWMLGRGWSLTPEVAGMTSADAAGLHQRPAEAFLLRGPRPLRVLIGGRYVGPPGGLASRLTVELDGQPFAEWTVTPDPIWFVHWLDLPALLPALGPDNASPYAGLTVSASPANLARQTPAVVLEQFDAAPAGEFIYAFADGWHEFEEDPRTGLVWRWTSDKSTIVVTGVDRDLRLTLRGESPLRYFNNRAPDVVVRAGAQELARFSPSADFVEQIDLPAAALAAASGRVTIETNLTFVPGKPGSGDQRRLGLKLFQIDITRR